MRYKALMSIFINILRKIAIYMVSLCSGFQRLDSHRFYDEKKKTDCRGSSREIKKKNRDGSFSLFPSLVLPF